jgi:vacuolar-type H+-ATPase subunit E/Vma4
VTEPVLRTLPEALRPVGSALLARARADAERTLGEADAEAADAVARARTEADAILAEARAQGEADAAGVLATERARARRQARSVVLAAQREALEALRSQVLMRVGDLRDDPAYPAWRDGLADRARAVLGEDAVVTEHSCGGVVGEAAGRRLAFTLEGLADQALDALGSDVEGLWSG